MGDVWLVRDPLRRDTLVLKLMCPIKDDERLNEEAKRRFLREIELGRSLNHPHILSILDSGWTYIGTQRVPYLVVPYKPEGSLLNLAKRAQPWSLVQIADMILQAAETLWYLHRHKPQIVHRDVKPANFLVESVGSARRAAKLYLCDFGIARMLHRGVEVEEASGFIGTYEFAAPEQIDGLVCCASDQYSLAVMACWLLTGRYPYRVADRQEYRDAHRHLAPILPSRLNPQRIPAGAIDEVIHRGLAKKPEERFPSVLAFGKALYSAIEALTEDMTAAGARSYSEVIWEPGAMLAPGTSANFSVQERDEREIIAPDVMIELDPEITSERILDEPLPEPRDAEESLEEHKQAQGPFYTPLPVKLVRSYGIMVTPRSLLWSPTGALLGCTCYDYPPLILGPERKTQLIQVRSALEAAALCWSPDGNIVAVSVPGGLAFWDVQRQRPYPLMLPYEGRPVKALDWSRRDCLAVWHGSQIDLYAITPETLSGRLLDRYETIMTPDMVAETVGVMHWSPKGSLLLAGGQNGMVVCWRVEGRTIRRKVLIEAQRAVTAVAWSPDGRWLSAAFCDRKVISWHVDNVTRPYLWTELPGSPRSISLTGDGRLMLALRCQAVLVGSPTESAPDAILPGRQLVACSPTTNEIAVLSETRENLIEIFKG
uniref:non-specific serine/threonine protein kinase n=1 Tax=Thermosporothrix sp. COM3 TaxID=2490863 RepID=A0A455SRL9_9CHLR|nr:hypothetical protein KTC_58180 [Thermosporothrix sp. COM3]